MRGRADAFMTITLVYDDNTKGGKDRQQRAKAIRALFEPFPDKRVEYPPDSPMHELLRKLKASCSGGEWTEEDRRQYNVQRDKNSDEFGLKRDVPWPVFPCAFTTSPADWLAATATGT